ncbi:protein O-linked-mannose beta-1,2-N-acetylglucosaminyltransferase 1-like [Acropora muricata]|uniref:protein O-linked-mannose beta-1,2-N-acetylglucosaminyltransferase 1-like n=1 Tax=Acropora muricata TaxID=159855 RepID=UPI0034E4B372
MSSWRPNPNAKPFTPASAYFSIHLPCKRQPIRVRKKGIFSRAIQWILVFVLCVTVVINLVFIYDTTRKFNKQSHEVNSQMGEEKFNNLQKSGAQSEGRRITIEVLSSKEVASVTVDGTKVLEALDEKARGINVAVLNQKTGAVMATRAFDTFGSQEDSDSLVLFINMVSDGRILCFTIRDEGTYQLKKTARNLMKTLGSENCINLNFRDMWAFVVKKRGPVSAEGYRKSPNFDSWAEPLTIQALVTLQSEDTESCLWEDNEISQRRKEFCEKYEGYGSVCSCSNPAPLERPSDPFPNGERMKIPVAIIASNRPNYLYRMIRSVLSAQGADATKITVFIDGYFEEPLAVARLFGIRGIQHTPISSKNARISQHYKASLTTTFNLYPDAEFMIILEEDLDVSTDIFWYFNQLLPILREDESLYCISAWNDQGYEHTVGDPAMLYRIETMPGLGWVLKRKLYKEELEPKWPTPDKFWDWDMWMRLPEIRKDRECVIPDVSRTYHFGSKGLNIHPYFQEVYFKKHALNTETNVKFHVEKTRKENYEKEIESLLSLSKVLDHSSNICAKEDFVPEVKGEKFVFYIKMEHGTDWGTWKEIARCLKIWDLDVRGFHKSMWRIWIKGNHVLIIGCPASPYCSHKPSDVTPIFIAKKENEQS